jgi:hypothetical protein
MLESSLISCPKQSTSVKMVDGEALRLRLVWPTEE